MLTLCIDTAYKHLTCALIKDEQILASISEMCFKKQSEELFSYLNKVFKQANINKSDIDSICVTEGPGSYTGVRIAMTLAKTMGVSLPCDVYTISTLRLYASDDPSTFVIMNARANRAYVGAYDGDEIILDDCVTNITDINTNDFTIIGDGSLLGKDDIYPNIPEAFLRTKHLWKKVENISFLVPKYLKESESYLQ